MQFKVEVELSDEELDAIKVADSLRAAQEAANRYSEHWRFFASMDGIYGKLDDLIDEVLCCIMDSNDAKTLKNLAIDNGESFEYNLQKNGDHFLRGFS